MQHETILKKLKSRKLDKDFYYFDTVDSTNSFAANIAQKGAPEWTLVLANEQTRGRGRLDRKWESERGAGLLFSIILKPGLPVFDIQLISLFLGIVITEFLELYTLNRTLKIKKNLQFNVKWPNDIFLNGKKMGGILLNSSIQNKIFSYIVCGIGLNINHNPDQFSNEIKDKSTSLKIETGLEWNREKMFVHLISFIKENYEKYDQGLNGIVERWKKKALFLGKEIKVHHFDELIRGKFIDVNPEGHLIIESYNGREEIITGDVFGRKEKI